MQKMTHKEFRDLVEMHGGFLAAQREGFPEVAGSSAETLEYWISELVAFANINDQVGGTSYAAGLSRPFPDKDDSK